jgi:hypothetical protein
MKIISGGQTGVDRAALDVAIERGMDWGGWCPKGGWAEDLTEPPGVLAKYDHLTETPLANPVQRTEWNVRDSDAALIIVDSKGLSSSVGTQRAHEWARKHGKPEFTAVVGDAKAATNAAAWLDEQRARFGRDLPLSIGGPRESESPGIYVKAKALIFEILSFIR